jgi:hypothetical protein
VQFLDAAKSGCSHASQALSIYYSPLFTIHHLPLFMEHELPLRIVLEKPPRDVDFGLQKGRGSSYETIQKQRFNGKDLSFEFSVRVKDGRKPENPRGHPLGGRESAPNFLGPMVQGAPGERFIYIDIGTLTGQTGTCWSRRLKIPLRGITWDMIDRVLADEESLLETRVPGTGKDGGPTCATVKPFPGWKLVSSRRR